SFHGPSSNVNATTFWSEGPWSTVSGPVATQPTTREGRRFISCPPVGTALVAEPGAVACVWKTKFRLRCPIAPGRNAARSVVAVGRVTVAATVRCLDLYDSTRAEPPLPGFRQI